MDALALLCDKDPNFPGYADEEARRLSDERVRAYLGEALARLQDRLGALTANDAFAKLMLRCEFANQIAFKPYEHARLSDEQINTVASCDAQLIQLADEAQRIDEATFNDYAQRVRAALDARDRAMESAA